LTSSNFVKPLTGGVLALALPVGAVVVVVAAAAAVYVASSARSKSRKGNARRSGSKNRGAPR
ncbi:MAG: hypothetical protein QXI37_03915, partial [Thermoprotei archaeon]